MKWFIMLALVFVLPVVGYVATSKAAENTAKPRKLKVVISPCAINADADKSQYILKIIGKNGEIVFTSECHHNKADAVSAFQSVAKDLAAGNWTLIDADGDYDAKGAKIPE